MLNRLGFAAATTLLFCVILPARADVKVVVDRNNDEAASPVFRFPHVAPPARDDAAAKATFTIVDGTRNGNGADLRALHDGQVPEEADEPESNFFFADGADGGRICIDLGRAIDVAGVNTYSWHTDTRAPQVYKLYASASGDGAGFNPAPKRDTDPQRAGWTLIASVDTRPVGGKLGGQFAVGISEDNRAIGKYRYLLFDVSRTEQADSFGNTFFSEIDVIEQGAAAATAPTTSGSAASASATTQPIELKGRYVTIDMTMAPDLKEWGETKLLPVCDEWYPILVKMLPSDGYTARDHFSIQFRNNIRVPAATGGGRVTCSISWFRKNLKGEALGAVVHEMVHVVQQYGAARRNNPDAPQNPGWLVEGIADYIRWFKYEPQTHGADVRDVSKAKYDASYRITANFLNFVTEKYDKDLVSKLNAAMRQGKYSPDLWKEYTGKTAEQLSDEWKQSLAHPAATTHPR